MATIQDERRGRPARVSVLQAIRRYPVVAIVPALLFAAIGVALGVARAPQYTATAQLSVGQLNIDNPAAIGSVVQASQQLASVYSRAISANSVRRAVAADLGSQAGNVTVHASPIPDSPVIRVTVTSSNERAAVAGANSASRALVAYARRSTNASAGQDLQARFRIAALRYAQSLDTLKRLKRRYGTTTASTGRRRINAAQAESQRLLLTREGLRARYLATEQSASSAPPLQSFSAASGTTSDRRRITQLLGLLGLLAGAALGTALATARLNRRVSRLTRP